MEVLFFAIRAVAIVFLVLVAALWDVQWDDVVPHFALCNAFTNALDNTSSFVAQNDWELLGRVQGLRVVRMAHTTPNNFDAHFQPFRGRDVYVNNLQLPFPFELHGGLASNGLSFS